MKKRFKKIVAAAMVAAVALTTNLSGLSGSIKIHAYTTVVVDGIQWQLESNGNEYSAKMLNPQSVKGGDVVVPDEIQSHSITRLDAGSISNCTIRTLTIPSSVKRISKDAIKSVSIETMNCGAAYINSNAITSCDIGTINFNAITEDHSYLAEKSFENCNMKKISFESSIKEVWIDRLAFNNCTELKDVVFKCDATLYSKAFTNCTSLKSVEFFKDVEFGAYNSYAWGDGYYGKEYGIFFNCFGKEYDGSNKLIKKAVKFNGNVSSFFVTGSAYHMFTSCSIFSTCPGLTDVEIVGKNVELKTPNFFHDCENLNNVTIDVENFVLTSGEYSSFYSLNTALLYKCPLLKELTINCTNYSANGKWSEYKDGSIETLSINAKKIEGLHVDNSSIKTLILDTESVSGDITSECTNLRKIIFPEEKYSIGENSLKGFTTHLTSVAPWVYGYYYNDLSYVATWTINQSSTGALEFKDIIGTLKSSCQKTFYVENDTELLDDYTADINDFKTQAIFAYENESDPENFFDVDPKNLTYSFPKKLSVGKVLYSVKYSGKTYSDGTINVEYIQPEELAVIWNDEFIDNLVSGDVVTAAQVVSSASIKCNNGDTRAVDIDDLKLESATSVVEGQNILNISYTFNGKTVSAEKTCTVNKNYITSITADLKDESKIRYVGDTLSADDFVVTAAYRNASDMSVQKTFVPSSLAGATLSVAGNNEVTVKYNDFSTTVNINAVEVVPVQISANYDKTYSYIEGQEAFDLSSFAATVTYNNGDEKKNVTLTNDNCKVVERTRTSNEVTVILQYKENGATVTSTEVIVPITPVSVTSISVETDVYSLVEGSNFDKSNIQMVTVNYNNGKRVIQDASTIDYANMIIDGTIIANKSNIITVTYLGATTTIQVQGIAKAVASISAQYTGKPIEVGDYFDAKDVMVSVYYTSGLNETITEGFIIRDADRQIVATGNNEVYVYYGSLFAKIIVPGVASSNSNPVITEEPIKTAIPDNVSGPGVINNPTTSPVITVAPTSNVVNIVEPTIIPNAVIDNASGVNLINSSIELIANIPSIKISTLETDKVYTNKNLKLQLTCNNVKDVKYQVVKKGSVASASGWKNVNNNTINVSMTKNASIVYIQYVDVNGTVQTIHTNVFFVDKTKAIANVKAGKTYKTNTKITFKDAGSGIKSAKLDGKKIKSGTKLKKKGNHTLVLVDKAGNKKSIKFKIK